MIIFQITLTGPMLSYLAALKHQEQANQSVTEILHGDGRFVTTMQSLIRQQLATHETPTNQKDSFRPDFVAKWATKERRFHYEITPKGMAALQLAGYDLQEFLDSVKKGLPPAAERYTTLYQERQASKPAPVGRGHRRAVAQS